MTKTISIRQPWAHAILHLGKTLENRTWPTAYRGTLLIHAAKGITHNEYAEAVWWMAHRGVAHPRGVPPMDQLQRGGIVGVCKLVDCVKQSSSLWFEGPYGFVLEGAMPVDFLECKGSLGLFDVAWPPTVKAKEEKGDLL